MMTFFILVPGPSADLGGGEEERVHCISCHRVQLGEDVMTTDALLGEDIMKTDAPLGEDIMITDAQLGEDVMTTDAPLGEDVMTTDAFDKAI